jgi:crotonobetainyl-CoA:carnitine CoA-transferase CaiB-like acyl-CoA transferase
MATTALDGLRVLDISTSVSGSWCSRLLADFGADVAVIEPASGHALRALGPFDNEGRSILAELLLANKRSVTLDLDVQPGPGLFVALARNADVVVSSAPPSWLRQRRLTYSDLAGPSLVMVHLTPYGVTGELAEVPGNDLTVAARSGWASINGLAGREPLKPSGWQASFCAGMAAYAATVAALHHRDLHPGEGQEIDVSELEVMVATFAPALLRGQYQGEGMGRRPEIDMTAGPVPVADGHFALTISRAHFWRDAMNLLGLDDLAEDTRWESGWYRAAHKDEYVGRVEERMRDWRKMDLFRELGSRRVIAGPVLTMGELAANDHLRARGFWTRPLSDAAGPEFPGAPFRMSATPWSIRTAAPPAGGNAPEPAGEAKREGVRR